MEENYYICQNLWEGNLMENAPAKMAVGIWKKTNIQLIIRNMILKIHNFFLGVKTEQFYVLITHCFTFVTWWNDISSVAAMYHIDGINLRSCYFFNIYIILMLFRMYGRAWHKWRERGPADCLARPSTSAGPTCRWLW